MAVLVYCITHISQKDCLTRILQKLPDKAVFFLFHTPIGQIPPEVPLPVPARIFPG